MAKQYFRLISDVTILYPRDYDLVDPTILDPASATTLFPGEWLKTVYSGAELKVQRGTGLETDPICSPYFADFKARTDVQAVKKVPLLPWLEYEGYTFICNTAGLTTVGQPLSVNDVTVDGFVGKRGLVTTPVGYNLVVASYMGPGEKTGEIRFLKKPGHFQTV